ncbi:MAG: histidinol-phosphate transaminase [Gammaproteobacteria bacterium]|jgi:histidinol-phosphate aminotransferase|nr:histidinol-phosphate transaminase [Gammaproteobacteria bacterium]
MTTLKPRGDLEAISPYKQGKSDLADHADPIKLSSNESSFGPSPNTIAAFKSIAENIHRYPDGSQTELRQAIADTLKLDANKIVCGNGSEELIGLVVRTYISPGDEMLLSENHFVMCPIYGRSAGADVIFAPEKNYRVDVDALLERVNDKTRMVIVANPNNPTGTYIADSEIRRLHAGLPENVLLLVDDAYAEYVTAEDYGSALDMVEQHNNVLVTRTFSKIFGLAGLRIGWAYCPQSILENVQRIRTPFNANSAAMKAAAAAIKDIEYIAMVREHTAKWQKIISERVTEMGIKILPSVTNFYLLDFAENENKSGADAAAFLESKGIIPRPAGSNSNTGYVRITVGLDDENEAVLKALAEYMSN